jgi:hypothetical protein
VSSYAPQTKVIITACSGLLLGLNYFMACSWCSWGLLTSDAVGYLLLATTSLTSLLSPCSLCVRVCCLLSSSPSLLPAPLVFIRNHLGSTNSEMLHHARVCYALSIARTGVVPNHWGCPTERRALPRTQRSVEPVRSQLPSHRQGEPVCCHQGTAKAFPSRTSSPATG